MTKLAAYRFVSRKAALRVSAAFALCLLLAFGVLWPAPLSFAASEKPVESAQSAASEPETSETPAQTTEPKAPVDDVDNVVVEAPATPAAPDKTDPRTTPEPTPAPEPEPDPVVPEYENAWPIGADEASSVVAELWADGTFVVDGAGAALAFDSADDVPWLTADVADGIKRVIFADKVEAESLAHWFEGCANLAEVANLPDDIDDMTRSFYDCPKLVELPDEFEFADGATLADCFGFSTPGEEPLITVYRGLNENVLGYAWDLDGRVLVNSDAPEPPSVDVPQESEIPEGSEQSEVPADEPSDANAEEPAGESSEETVEEPAETLPADGAQDGKKASVDEAAKEPAAQPEAAEPAAGEPASEEDTQVNITVPSSVSMMLGVEGENTAMIPVAAANRSERNVAIVGARLKRSSQDLPGGSWSLTTESGSTTFVQDARFTPLGLEVTFDRPVVLAAGDENTMLVWHGSFTDFGMKTLLQAALDAGDERFAYGSMIWIVSAA